MSSQTKNSSECCPKFDPSGWDEKDFTWENKKFVKDTVFTLFYLPVNFGAVITRLIKKVENAGANALDWLCLSDHASKWKMEIFLAVDKNVPQAQNITLSGRFISKVYEGDFKETKAWRDDFKDYAKKKGLTIKKWYMWYTTCPKCAKKYGKNYVVFVGEVG